MRIIVICQLVIQRLPTIRSPHSFMCGSPCFGSLFLIYQTRWYRYEQKQRQLHLNLFVSPMGHHEAAWRHPQSNLDQLLDFALYQRLAAKRKPRSWIRCFCGSGSDQPERGQVWGDRRVRTANAPIGTCRRHSADRSDRDRVHELQRAVQSGSAVCFSRPS